MDSSRHTGRIALLTGTGSGIGLATAIRLAAEGATVVGGDVKAEGVEAARAAVPGGTFTVCDVTDQCAVDALVGRALADHGRIDILGNIAGINDSFLPAHEVDDATWDRVLAVNTTAVMRLCRAVLPGMQERHSGAIVNIASIAGLGGGASGLAYTASKHAVVGMTRSIAWMYRAEASAATRSAPVACARTSSPGPIPAATGASTGCDRSTAWPVGWPTPTRSCRWSPGWPATRRRT